MCDTLIIGSIMDARDKLVAALNAGRNKFPAMSDIISDITNDKQGDFLAESVDCPGKIAYSRLQAHRYDANRRTQSNLARYINRQCDTIGIPETTIEKFAYFVQSNLLDSVDSFRILSGRAIVDAYMNQIGGSSCMTGNDYDDSYVQVYGCNDNVSLLVYQDKKMEARALLWTTDCGTKILDRIYPNSGYHIELFRGWCKENDVLQRIGNHLPSDDVGIDGGGEYFVTLSRSENSNWPFMDTFRFCDDTLGSLTLSNFENNHALCLESITGGIEETNSTCCCSCEDSCDDDSDYRYNGSQYCCGCFNEFFWTCDREGTTLCRDNDPGTYIEDTGETWCQWAVDNYASQCDMCGDTVSEWNNHGDNSHCEDCNDTFNELSEKVDEIKSIRDNIIMPCEPTSEANESLGSLDTIVSESEVILQCASNGTKRSRVVAERLSALANNATEAAANINEILEGELCKN